MTQIPALHTSCKSCCFAIYEDDTQVGCDAFVDLSKAIEAYDDEAKFYIIPDQKCLYYRQRNQWTGSLDDAKNEIDNLKFATVVIVLDSHSVLDNILLFCQGLEQYKHLVNLVICCDNKTWPKERIESFYNAVRKLGITWELKHFLSKESLETEKLLRVLNRTKKLSYVTLMTSAPSNDLLTDLDKYVLVDGARPQGIVYQTDQKVSTLIVVTNAWYLHYAETGNGYQHMTENELFRIIESK